jgi:hypothetical protein
LKNLLSNKPKREPLSAEQIEIRVWAFVVIIVMVVFAGITASMLYSVIFVTQPIKSMAPIDQAFAKMLNDIVLLIVGGIGAIMAKKGLSATAGAFTPPPSPCHQQYSPVPNYGGGGALPVWVNPALDETWTPGPPPTTPPDHLESDDVRAEIATARAEDK